MDKVTDIISRSKMQSAECTAEDVVELSRRFGSLASSLGDRSLIVVLEGLDASGKSGCASRITEHIPEDVYRTVHVTAPDDEEKRYGYLWRFWRQIPPSGGITVFDRSWYGRVLVERVDSLCTAKDWRRAYGEINDFERYLTDNGAVLMKFWLEVSDEVQLERFLARAEDPRKRHKITEDDWKGRAKRTLYDRAVSDMFRETDTKYAPWHVIPANHKKSARAKVLSKLIAALSE